MSNNLSLSQVAAAQNQKEITINDQAAEIDAALTEVLSVVVNDTNALSLTDSQFRRKGAEARRSMEVVLAIYESARTGTPVKL